MATQIIVQPEAQKDKELELNEEENHKEKEDGGEVSWAAVRMDLFCILLRTSV